MLRFKTGIFILCAVIITSDSTFVESLSKCPIDDGDCQKELYQSVLQRIGKSGIPELNVPPIDPISLKNVSIDIVNVINIIMVDGIATGIKDCVFHSAVTDIENGHAMMVITCDITVKGHYTASLNTDFVKNILGDQAVNGDGYAKVKLEKLVLKFDYDFYIRRGDDGETYIQRKDPKTVYDYEILGKPSFYINKLLVGGQDLSELVTVFLNENGKYLLRVFGKPFMDKAMEFVYIFTHKFFDVVPTKYYISDDLSVLISQTLNQNGKNFAPLFGKPFIEKALEIVYKYASMWFEAVPAKFYIQEDLSPYIINN